MQSVQTNATASASLADCLDRHGIVGKKRAELLDNFPALDPNDIDALARGCTNARNPTGALIAKIEKQAEKLIEGDRQEAAQAQIGQDRHAQAERRLEAEHRACYDRYRATIEAKLADADPERIAQIRKGIRRHHWIFHHETPDPMPSWRMDWLIYQVLLGSP